MFKGFEKAKDVQYVFTPLTSAVCGVTLEEGAKKKNQYLLSGVNVTRWKSFYLCDFIKPWNDLTNSQKNNLREKYKRGCDCKVNIWHTTSYKCLVLSELGCFLANVSLP
uniref:Metalloproteinase inhibitor 4 n=1 Tax=Naja naja TaxID=35670 RepID=A0A8C7E6Q4_NAJNA